MNCHRGRSDSATGCDVAGVARERSKAVGSMATTSSVSARLNRAVNCSHGAGLSCDVEVSDGASSNGVLFSAKSTVDPPSEATVGVQVAPRQSEYNGVVCRNDDVDVHRRVVQDCDLFEDGHSFSPLRTALQLQCGAAEEVRMQI